MTFRKCNSCGRKGWYKQAGKWWCCLTCELSGRHTYACDRRNGQ